MKSLFHLRGRGRYTIYGVLFGATFPIIAWLFVIYISRDVYVMFYVICTAPIVLGVMARIAGIRQDRLDSVNLELEDLVEDRMKSIQSLLDVSGQGFLYFDRGFRVGSEYSRACESLFGVRIEGRQIDELLFPGLRAREDFRNGLILYFNGSAKPDVIFDLLERTTTVGGRTLRVEYRAINANRVMVILTDSTDEVRLQEETRAENERRSMLLKVIANRRAFGLFTREAEALFAALEQPRDGYDETLRDIHSFKGNAGFLGFRTTQQSAHELEDSLTDAISLGQDVHPQQRIQALRTAYVAERAVISEALGAEWVREGDLVEIPRVDYLRIEGHVRKHYPTDTVLITALEGHRMSPISELFERFPLMAKDLAGRMGKRVELHLTGGGMAVATEEFEPLVTSFTHILRNMIDHGIELPAEREAAGKPPSGDVRVDIAERAQQLAFTLTDDGRGVRLDEVEKKGRELGLIAEGEIPSSAQLLGLIFRDGFSTSRQASVISGRGVGLAAVREAVRKKGGRISVRTTAGQGTTFVVTVPRRRQGEVGA